MVLPEPAPTVLRRSAAALAGVVAVVLATLLVVGQPRADVGVPTAGAGPDTDPQVLVVSLDGFNPRVLRTLGRSGLPHLWRLFDEGAGTLDARTQLELTDTLPNHTSMVTGRRIDRRRGGHGVTWNDDRPRPRTVQRAAGHRVESVFTRVAAHGASAALFAAKTKFRLWQRSWPRALDRVEIRDEDDAAVVRLARDDLSRRDRALTFVHLGAADRAGHAAGWLTPTYLDAVRSLDRLVGLLETDVDTRPELADVTVVLTADHGGSAGHTRHSAPGVEANYTVPFVVWGPEVDHADLYAVNPGYVAPGRTRPDLVGRQPVRNGDVANLALSLLGHEPVPGSLFGHRRPLRVR